MLDCPLKIGLRKTSLENGQAYKLRGRSVRSKSDGSLGVPASARQPAEGEGNGEETRRKTSVRRPKTPDALVAPLRGAEQGTVVVAASPWS